MYPSGLLRLPTAATYRLAAEADARLSPPLLPSLVCASGARQRQAEARLHHLPWRSSDTAAARRPPHTQALDRGSLPAAEQCCPCCAPRSAAPVAAPGGSTSQSPPRRLHLPQQPALQQKIEVCPTIPPQQQQQQHHHQEGPPLRLPQAAAGGWRQAEPTAHSRTGKALRQYGCLRAAAAARAAAALAAPPPPPLPPLLMSRLRLSTTA